MANAQVSGLASTTRTKDPRAGEKGKEAKPGKNKAKPGKNKAKLGKNKAKPGKNKAKARQNNEKRGRGQSSKMAPEWGLFLLTFFGFLV